MPCIYVSKDSVVDPGQSVEEFYGTVFVREEGMQKVDELNAFLTPEEKEMHIVYHFTDAASTEREFYGI